MSDTRLPPHSIDAEQAVLGSILIDPDAMLEIADFLRPSHFYDSRNQLLFKICMQLVDERVPIDLLVVSERAARQRPDDGALAAYTIGLVTAVPTSINVHHYAKIVEEAAVRRSMIAAGSTIAQLAYDQSITLDEAIRQGEGALLAVSDTAVRDVQHVKVLLDNLVDVTLQRIEAGGTETPGLPTGLIDLDRMLGGFRRQQVTILAGRPGMGKSIAERTIALNVALAGGRVAEFNLEMPGEALIRRHIAGMSGLRYEDIEKGRLDAKQVDTFMRAVGRVSSLQMYIDDTPGLTITQLRAKCRRIKARHGLDLVTVDYLQLMTAERRHGNREQEIGEISRGLVLLAKELDVPVLALAQLSRSVESRADKRPLLSDLRDSGTIEQDGSVVIFIYRDEYYNEGVTERPNIVEFGIGKNRNGSTGTIDAYFNGALSSIRNLQRQELEL